MASKEGNNTSLPIYYEQQHGNMVSFFLPLKSTFLEPRINQEDREAFLVFEVQVWVWTLSLKFKFEIFKLGSVFQPTRSLFIILV